MDTKMKSKKSTASAEHAKKQQRSAKLENTTEDKMVEYGMKIARIHREVAKVKKALEDFSIFLSTMRGFDEHRVATAKIAALQRLAVASKAGIDRSIVHYYDVQRMVVRESVVRDMENSTNAE